MSLLRRSKVARVCAVLLGSGGLADYTPTLLKNIESPGANEIIYDTDPERLVNQVIAMLDKNTPALKSTKTIATWVIGLAIIH